jgi:uncharacterized repeat protein (TIGR02543 family)
MKRILQLTLTGIFALLLSLAALAGPNQWSGTGPFATGAGNRVVGALASSPDGVTVYAGTDSGTVFSYEHTAPSVTTSAATGVSPTGATLNGTVNAANDSTTVSLAYGLSAVYGSTAAATQSPVTGASDTPVSATVSSLACNTLYHFRAIGINGEGTTNGSDLTFTTSACPTYTLTYNSNSPSIGNAPTDGAAYLAGASVTVLGNTGSLAKTGYTFVGWNLANDGSSTHYAVGANVTIAGNLTLYAEWLGIPVASAAYPVSFNGFTANWVSAASAAGYYLDVATDSGFAGMVAGYGNKDVGNVTSLAITGLSSNTAYYYRVRAYNGSGTSDNSNVISPTTGRSLVVTTNADSGAGSLRQTIADAIAGDGITFAGDVTGTITLVSPLAIAKNLAIVGPGASILTLSGNDATGIIQISGATVFSLQSLTLAHGAWIGGGALVDNSSATTSINSCVFSGNTGTGGGAMLTSGNMTISNSAFTANAASGSFGGAIYASGGTVMISNSSFDGNTAPAGGAIANGAASMTLTNVTLNANAASNSGGALYSAGGSILNLVHVTIAGNSATANGGGIAVAGGGSVNLKNTLVADNTAATAGPDIFGAVNSQDYNLIGTLTVDATVSGSTSHNLAGNSGTPIAPLLAALADNGGSTRTMALRASSPALDAVPSGANGCGTSPATDQRGMARAQNGLCDIGAYERGIATTLVTSGGTSQSTVVNTAFGSSLGASVADALGQALDGVDVTFTAPGSGASGIFSNSAATIVVASNGAGLAAPTFTANTVAGGPFNVTAAAAGLTTVNYSMTNTPGALTQLLVSAPGAATAGTAFSVTVTARDAYNNTASGYAGTVRFTKSDAGAGSAVPSNYTFVGGDAGMHTFTNAATLVTPGNQTITVTDTVVSSINGSSGITVSPGVASQLVVSAPGAATAGSAFSITVTARDAYGNTASGYAGTVHFTKTDTGAGSAIPVNYTFTGGDAGVHLFTNGVTLVSAGNKTITATDTVSSSLTGTSGSIAVAPLAATHLAVSAPASATPGSAFTLTVAAKDAFNNTATSYVGTVRFTKSDSGAGSALPSNYTFTIGDAGAHTFTNAATLVTTGTQTITTTDAVTSSITGASGGISVAPIPTYSVTYDGNGNTGGAVPVDGATYLSWDTVVVKTNSGSLLRSGYAFTGWNTQPGGAGISYAATGASSFNLTGDTTLYAQWRIASLNAFFINASTSPNKTSVLRIINLGDQSGRLTATAYDEAGKALGSANRDLGAIGAQQMLTFTSAQLETTLGYTPVLPTAKYRVVFNPSVPTLQLINFVKDLATGNMTLGQAQTDRQGSNLGSASNRDGLFVNASSSTNKTSVVRLINATEQSGAVTATAYNEAGHIVGTSNASLGTIGAQQMLTFSSTQLEAAIGYVPASPTAKYSIVFSATLPSFEAINFVKDIASGNLTLGQAQTYYRGISTATSTTRNALAVNSSTNPLRTSVVRLINIYNQAGNVTATTYNEAGNTVGTVNAAMGMLAADQMLTFTSAQLESVIGYTAASPTATYRVAFTVNLPGLELIDFIKETTTGNLFLAHAQIDDRDASVAAATTRNALFINASTSANKTSIVRLINLGSQKGSLTASAYDESGNSIGTPNALLGSLGAQQTLSFTSAQLEATLRYTPSSQTSKYRIVFTANLPSFEVINYISDVATGRISMGQAQVN